MKRHRVEPLIIPPTGTERYSTLLYRNAPKIVYQMQNLPHDISRTAVNPQVACEERERESLRVLFHAKYCPVSAESRGRPVGRSITPRAGILGTKTRDDGTVVERVRAIYLDAFPQLARSVSHTQITHRLPSPPRSLV